MKTVKQNIEELVFKNCYKFLKAPVIVTSGESITPFFLNGENMIGPNAKRYSEFEMDPRGMMRFVRGELETCDEFKQTMNYIVKNNNFSDVEYISGGRTRDWPFSAALAAMTNKKALFLYKPQDNQKPMILHPKHENSVAYCENLEGAKVFHIVDLVTTASSIADTNGWLDQIRLLNGNINEVYSVIDRNQGATEILKSREVKLKSAVQINESWLKQYDPQNLETVQSYLENPQNWSIEYLLQNGISCLTPYLDANTAQAKKDNRILKFIYSNTGELTQTGLLEQILDSSVNYRANKDEKKGLDGTENLTLAISRYK